MQNSQPILTLQELALLEGVDEFTTFGTKVAQHQQVTDFFLYRPSGVGIRLSITMIDVAVRLELGVLRIEMASEGYRPEVLISLPSKIKNDPRYLLTLNTECGKVNSGVMLQMEDEHSIIIVSGANPFTLAIQAPFIPRPFTPEYDVKQYTFEPIKSEA